MDPPGVRFAAALVIRSDDSTRPVQSIALTGHGDISKIKVSNMALKKAVPDDHVEVEVHYCGLNFTDNYLRLGIIRSRNFPIIMGSECSGIVKRVGDKVTDLQVGQKVLCLQMQGGLFRHYVHVHHKYCFLLPDNISLKNAVGLGLNFVVAHLCLYEFGRLGKSDKVFMQSIAGGVGTALVQLAKTVDDVEVIGTTSESKHEKLKSLGVNRIFSHKENYETGILQDYPEGVDIVVNTNGGSEIEKCLKILQPVGRVVLLGSNSTATYPKSTRWGIIRPEWDSGSMSSSEIIGGSHCVAAVDLGMWSELHPEEVHNILREIFKLYSSGKIEPCIHDVLPFSQVAEGIKELCCRKNFGKVILEVEEEAAKNKVEESSTSADPQPEALEEPKGKADSDVQEEDLPSSMEPKEKADPDVQKESPPSAVEPKVGEPSSIGDPEEKGAEGTTAEVAP